MTSTLFTTPHNLSLSVSLSCPSSVLTSPCLTVVLSWHWGTKCVQIPAKTCYFVILSAQLLFWMHCISKSQYLYHFLALGGHCMKGTLSEGSQMQGSTQANTDVNACPKYCQLTYPMYLKCTLFLKEKSDHSSRRFTQMLNGTIATFEAKLWMQRVLVLHYKLRSDTFQNSMVHEIELA